MEVGPSSSVFLKHGEFNYLKDWHDQTEFNNKQKTVATMVGWDYHTTHAVLVKCQCSSWRALMMSSL